MKLPEIFSSSVADPDIWLGGGHIMWWIHGIRLRGQFNMFPSPVSHGLFLRWREANIYMYIETGWGAMAGFANPWIRH